MIKKFLTFPLFSFFIYLFAVSPSCTKDPYVPDYDHAGGFVIAKETCSATDPDNDYWLVDLSVNYTTTSSSLSHSILVPNPLLLSVILM